MNLLAYPSGYHQPPRAKILIPAVAFLRKNETKLMFYLDDMFIISPTNEQTKLDFNMTKELLEELGFIVHQTKSIAAQDRLWSF